MDVHEAICFLIAHGFDGELAEDCAAAAALRAAPEREEDDTFDYAIAFVARTHIVDRTPRPVTDQLGVTAPEAVNAVTARILEPAFKLAVQQCGFDQARARTAAAYTGPTMARDSAGEPD